MDTPTFRLEVASQRPPDFNLSSTAFQQVFIDALQLTEVVSYLGVGVSHRGSVTRSVRADLDLDMHVVDVGTGTQSIKRVYQRLLRRLAVVECLEL